MEGAGFKEEEEVEVCGESEGSKDTWYYAKIMKQPNRKNKTKILVEYYRWMASEQGLKRHQNWVKPCSIRPLPPRVAHAVFDCYQDVDAFYNDGWKKGSIDGVHDKVSRYTVYFPLSKEKLDFGVKELRVHLDWVDAKWVDYRYQDIGIDQAQLFNVDIKDESLKRERKFSHTIPRSGAQSSPPNKKLHKGEASQETVGLSLSDESTELPNLKLCQEKTRSDFDGDRSGNQKKVADSYPPTIKGEPCDWSRSIYQVDYLQKNLAVQSSVHSTEPMGAHDIGIDQAQLFNVDITDKSLTRKRKIDHTIPSSDAQYPPPNKKLHQGEASQVTVGMSPSDRSTDLPKLKLCQEKTRSAFDGDRPGNQEKVAGSSFSFPLTIKGEPCDWSRSIYQVNYPQNSLAAQSSAHSTEPLGAHDINQNKGSVAGCQSIENISEAGVSTDNQLTSQLYMAITSAEAPTKGNEAQEAMCLKEDENTGDQCHDALENGDNEIVMAAFLNDHNSNLNVLENESLPFIKSSPGWKDVESNEIFRSMPQKPHFRPLQKKPELLREGKALGLMVSFGSLVEKISKTHYDEPKSILEDNLKLLSYFKSFGFNVQPIQDRQEELLRVKEEEVQIDRKLKHVEGKIVKGEIEEEGLRLDIVKFDMVLGEYNEKIRKLQEYVNKMSKERQIVVEIKQTAGSILASLRDSRNKIEKERQSTKQKFNCIAAAPW